MNMYGNERMLLQDSAYVHTVQWVGMCPFKASQLLVHLVIYFY